jgi:hypothetical protein
MLVRWTNGLLVRCFVAQTRLVEGASARVLGAVAALEAAAVSVV